MLCADDVEGAVEVTLDGTDREASGDGNLGDIHLVQKAEQEDGSLSSGEVGYRLPDERDLLLGDEVRFG